MDDPSLPAIHDVPHPDRRRMSTATSMLIVLLCLYWAALFYATHTTIPPGLLPGNSDKFVHFVAYAGLGILLMAVQATRGFDSWVGMMWLWLILAAYGVFDELTQLLVNRNADIRDWMFDITGAAAGLILVFLVVRWIRPKFAQGF